MPLPDLELLGIIKGCKTIPISNLAQMVGMEEIVVKQAIMNLVKQELVEMTGESVVFVTSEVEPNLMLLDVIILGYIKLRKLCNVEDICTELSINESEALESVGRLCLQETIELKLYYETHIEEFLVYVELLHSDFELQLQKIESTNQYLMKAIERNYIIKDLDLNSFQVLIGFMRLMREFDWKNPQIATLVDNRHQLLSKIYENKHVIEMICLLSLDPSIEMRIVDTKYIDFQLKSKLSSINVTRIFQPKLIDSILTFLSGSKMVALSELSGKFDNHEDIIPILLTLAYEGILEGVLDDDGTLHIHQVVPISIQNETLTAEERVILGYLKVENRPNAVELARYLSSDKNHIKDKLQTFPFFRKSGAQIARNNDILMDNDFTIPLNNSIANIPDVTQELLGVLIWHTDDGIKKILRATQMHQDDFMRQLCLLVGNGLIDIKLNKSKLELRNIANYSPNMDENMFSEILSNIDPKSGKFNWNSIEKQFDLPQRDFVNIKYRFIANYHSYIEKISEDEGVFTHIPESMKRILCIYCSNPINKHESSCENCGKSIEYCTVCRAVLGAPVELFKCPNCHGMSHRDHILQWLVIRDICPVCKMSIATNQLLEVETA